MNPLTVTRHDGAKLCNFNLRNAVFGLLDFKLLTQLGDGFVFGRRLGSERVYLFL